MNLSITPSDFKKTILISNGIKTNFPVGYIGINSYINCADLWVTPNDEVVNLQIGNYCSIANNISILINRNHDYKSITTSSINIFNFGNMKITQKGQILIGNDVWIGNDTILLSGIKIGNGAVIGAGAVVSKDIPPYAIAVGNPIKVIKYRFNEEQIKKLQCIKWWNWDASYIKKNREWFSKNVEDFTNKFYKKFQPTSNIAMSTKNNSILFYPDFLEPYCIWKKVISEYMNKFTNKDDVTLVLRILQSKDFQQRVNLISEMIAGKQNLPDVLVLNDIIEDERSIFKKVKYFVTTRSMETIKFVEMANEFGVKVLSGVDVPVFNLSCNYKK